MTNAELIAKIREEIERLIEESDFDESANLYSLLSFLSTLEEQAKYKVRNPIFDEWLSKVNPKVREEVRENINRMLEDDSLIDEIKNFIKEYGYERGEDKLLIAIVARHFYELGCRRTAEKYDEIEYNRQREGVPNDLEEAAVEYSKEVSDGHNYRDLRVGFIAGAKWDREQMLKTAEECELYWDGDFLAIDLNMAALGYYERDKVKIIIVKED